MASNTPPKDKMVTRFKVAQKAQDPPNSTTPYLRKLLNPEKVEKIDGGVSTKCPVTIKGKKSPKKGKIKIGSANSRSENKVTIDEYYPNKLKRQVFTKKVVLKPKYNMKVVAKTSKRKLSTPHKGMRSPLPSPHRSLDSSPELSVMDVIRVFEETQELDDEDLMEILTCPSPVWWEDPPDPSYIEDAICKRPAPTNEVDNKENNLQIKETEEKSDLEINIHDKDVNFTKKRSKLEILLNNLKVKVNNSISGINNESDITLDKDSSESTLDSHDRSKKLDNEIIQNVKLIKKDNKHKSVLYTKGKYRKIKIVPIKISKRPIAKVNNLNCDLNKQGTSDLKSDLNKQGTSGCAGHIKIKTPFDINREAQEKLDKNDSNNETDKQDINSEVKQEENTPKTEEVVVDRVTLPEEKRDVECKNNDVKDSEDSVLSESEISVNEETLKELENINIPIEDNSYEKVEDVETNTNSDSKKQQRDIKPSNKKVKNKPIKKKRNSQSTKCMKATKKAKLMSEMDEIDVNTVIFGNPEDYETILTEPTEKRIEEDVREKVENDTPVNSINTEESVDSYEFDLEFENAILGLENAVLIPAKARKLNINPKIKTKFRRTNLRLPKKEVIKIIAGGSKTENVPSKIAHVKRKQEHSMDDTKDDSKGESDISESKIRKVENIKRRGRVKRKKALIDIDTDNTEKNDVKQELPNDSNLESSLTEESKETAYKETKRKQEIKSPDDIKKETVSTTSKDDQITKTESNNDISKRGRIRRKKLPFSNDSNETSNQTENTKTKSNKNISNKRKSKGNNNSSEMNDAKRKIPKSASNSPKKCVKQYVNNKNKLNSKIDISNESNNSDELEKNESNTEKIAANKAETKSVNKSKSEPKTLQSVFTKFVEDQGFDANSVPMPKLKKCEELDSISDSGVTFIDESIPETTRYTKGKDAVKKEINTDEDNSEEIDDINRNLGPNFESSPDKNNDVVVLNTESKRLVTVQSDREVIENSNDFETITVFKIIPKDLE